MSVKTGRIGREIRSNPILFGLAIMLWLLAGACAPADKFNNSSLRRAASNGDTEFLREYLLAGGDPNVRIEDKTVRHYTLIQIAAVEGHTTAVQLLLDHQADPNLKDWRGLTALTRAIGSTSPNALDCITLLLEHGADPNLKSNDGSDALLFAVRFGKLDVAKLMLRNGALPSSIDQNGYNALHHAKDPEMARILLAHGTDPTAINVNGHTPLDTAKRNQNTALVRLLSAHLDNMKTRTNNNNQNIPD